MLYVKRDRLKDLEKYGFYNCGGTYVMTVSSKCYGYGSELNIQLIVNPWEDNSQTNDKRLIVNAYMCVDRDDAETMDAPIEEETSSSLDVIYDMIADGIIEKRD